MTELADLLWENARRESLLSIQRGVDNECLMMIEASNRMGPRFYIAAAHVAIRELAKQTKRTFILRPYSVPAAIPGRGGK